MKKEERLHRLLGDIDDDLVADAARKPIRKAVWVPAVAAAACVALTVGLWQGGVFDPAEIPVETPDESTTTTAEPTEPSKDATTTTAEPTEPSKADPSKTAATTTEKPTEPSKDTTTTPAKPINPSKNETTKTTASSKTEPNKTTSVKEKQLIFADEPTELVPDAIPIGGFIFSSLKEKMELYKGQDVLYAVIVEVFPLPEDIAERYPPHCPQPEYFKLSLDQRVEKLKEIVSKELVPASTDDRYSGFYACDDHTFLMELTAEEIHELDKCGCFIIRLRHPEGDAEAGIVIPE